MIPTFAVIKFRAFPIAFWVPVFLLWILLAPIGLFLAPFLVIACFVFWINPLRLLGILFSILSAVRGLRIEIEHPEANIRVQII